MTWKPRKYSWLVEITPVLSVGNSSLIGLGDPALYKAAITSGRSCTTLLLEKTWRYLFALPEFAIPRVQLEYWSLLIDNGIVVQ